MHVSKRECTNFEMKIFRKNALTVSLAERPKPAPACLRVYWDGTEDAHASAFGLDPLDQWLNNTRALFNCLCKLLKMKSFHV